MRRVLASTPVQNVFAAALAPLSIVIGARAIQRDAAKRPRRT